MKVRAVEWGLGLLFSIYGAAMIWTEDYHCYGQEIPSWVAYVIAIVGIAIPVMGLVFRSTPKGREESKRHERDSELHVCLKCEAVSRLGESRNGRCPKCGGGMEPLEGFYERNPELKS